MTSGRMDFNSYDDLFHDVYGKCETCDIVLGSGESQLCKYIHLKKTLPKAQQTQGIKSLNDLEFFKPINESRSNLNLN